MRGIVLALSLPGLGPSAVFPGVPAGQTVTYIIEFIASTPGAVDWTMFIYAVDVLEDEVGCGSGTTAIR